MTKKRKPRGPKPSTKVTLREIAGELGVAKGTVSKALRKAPELRTPREAQIAEHAAYMGYLSPEERTLIESRLTVDEATIHVVLADPENVAYGHISNRIIRHLNERGHTVQISVVARKGDEYSIIKSIRAKPLVCILIGSEFLSSETFDIKKRGVRLIQFLVPQNIPYLDAVTVDFERAGEIAGAFFVRQGRYRPLLILDRNQVAISNALQSGFVNRIGRTAAAQAEVEIIDLGYKECKQRISDMLFDSIEFDFVLCANDQHAQACIHASLPTSSGASDVFDIVSLGNLLWGDLPPNPVTATLVDTHECIFEVARLADQICNDFQMQSIQLELAPKLIRNTQLNW